jgi:hypothetical protein
MGPASAYRLALTPPSSPSAAAREGATLFDRARALASEPTKDQVSDVFPLVILTAFAGLALLRR